MWGKRSPVGSEHRAYLACFATLAQDLLEGRLDPVWLISRLSVLAGPEAREEDWASWEHDRLLQQLQQVMPEEEGIASLYDSIFRIVQTHHDFIGFTREEREHTDPVEAGGFWLYGMLCREPDGRVALENLVQTGADRQRILRLSQETVALVAVGRAHLGSLSSPPSGAVAELDELTRTIWYTGEAIDWLVKYINKGGRGEMAVRRLADA